MTLLTALTALLLSHGVTEVWAQKRDADPPDEGAATAKAKEQFLKGSEAAERGDSFKQRGKAGRARKEYARAARYFLAAYKAKANPYFLFSLGEVFRARGDSKWALACYRRLVELVDTFDESKAGLAARESLPTARKYIARLNGKADKGDSAIEPIGVCTRLPETPEPDGPEKDILRDPAVVVDDSGRTDRGGRSGRGLYRAGFYASAGVAVTSIVLAGVFHAQVGGSIKDDHIAAVTAYQESTGQALPIDDACTGARERRDGAFGNEADLLDDVISACDRGESRALMSNSLQFVTAVSVAAAGFFLYKGYLAKAPRTRERATALIPTVTPSSVGAQLTVWF